MVPTDRAQGGLQDGGLGLASGVGLGARASGVHARGERGYWALARFHIGQTAFRWPS